MRMVTNIWGSDPLICSKLRLNLDPTTVEELIESASSFPNPNLCQFGRHFKAWVALMKKHTTKLSTKWQVYPPTIYRITSA